jgi:uncharacterized ferritin-like protein (DUF455 family)
METHEFALKVLFSSSLEEKLQPADQLTDEDPGPALGTPGEPGRPVDLRLRTDGVRVDFPGDSKLVNEEQRGILLHFFANHELLATELMALVLLKFPDAPREFRRGIVRTLQEEQQHTTWYMRRMAQCGITFGDFPVNRFFWDSIAPMETPLDYVTRLSLTFEQANLDYARHYSTLMQQVGDEKTARILDRIYRDEIGHVGYGLKWFRRWKAEGPSDWEAYQKQLSFPLSPARGRGNVAFNDEGRRRAGLTEEFIREMELFSRSKGRTPNVFWFTPDAEVAMVHGLDGKGFAPGREAAQLRHDLEILPAFLAHRDDVLLLSRLPSAAHRRKLLRLGLELPECEALDADGTIPADSLQRTRKLHELRPWAWCPQSAALLRPLDEDAVNQHWQAETRRLFAKDWQVKNLGLESAVCRTEEEVAEAIRTLCEQGYEEGMAKLPFGAAAQKNRKFSTSAPQNLHRILASQGAVIIEPYLQRVFDFSVQYEATPTGVQRLAFIQLENDRRGQFQACVTGPKISAPPEVMRFLMHQKAFAIYEKEIPEKLHPLLQAAGYCGPVGIDAFVYRTPEGQLRLRPIVEMNPRYTMGRLTWELMRRVAHGRTVRFELIRSTTPAESTRTLEAAHPPQLNKDGKLISGCVVLNEPGSVLAVLTVGQMPEP